MSNGTKGKKVPLQVIASLKSIRNFSVFFASLSGAYFILLLNSLSTPDALPWILLHLFLSCTFVYAAVNIQYQIDGESKVGLAMPTLTFVLSLLSIFSIIGIFIAYHLYKERQIISYYTQGEKDNLTPNSQWSKSHPKEWSDTKSITLSIITGLIIGVLPALAYLPNVDNSTPTDHQKAPTANELIEYIKKEISLPFTYEENGIIWKDIVSETNYDITYIYEVPDESSLDIDREKTLRGLCTEEDSLWQQIKEYGLRVVYKYIYIDGELTFEPNDVNCR